MGSVCSSVTGGISGNGVTDENSIKVVSRRLLEVLYFRSCGSEADWCSILDAKGRGLVLISVTSLSTISGFKLTSEMFGNGDSGLTFIGWFFCTLSISSSTVSVSTVTSGISGKGEMGLFTSGAAFSSGSRILEAISGFRVTSGIVGKGEGGLSSISGATAAGSRSLTAELTLPAQKPNYSAKHLGSFTANSPYCCCFSVDPAFHAFGSCGLYTSTLFAVPFCRLSTILLILLLL